MTFEHLGPLVRSYRRARGLSQRQVVEKTGIQLAILSKMENNRLTQTEWPGGDKLLALCDLVTLDEAQVLALAGKIPTCIKEALRDPRFMRMCMNAVDCRVGPLEDSDA